MYGSKKIYSFVAISTLCRKIIFQSQLGNLSRLKWVAKSDKLTLEDIAQTTGIGGQRVEQLSAAFKLSSMKNVLIYGSSGKRLKIQFKETTR